MAAPCLILIPAQTVHGFDFSADVDGPVVTAAQRPLESLAGLSMPELLSVKQLAEALGVADETYFGRFFRKHAGLSPREFRAKALGAMLGGGAGQSVNAQTQGAVHG